VDGSGLSDVVIADDEGAVCVHLQAGGEIWVGIGRGLGERDATQRADGLQLGLQLPRLAGGEWMGWSADCFYNVVVLGRV
jgi:hypothetical protein